MRECVFVGSTLSKPHVDMLLKRDSDKSLIMIITLTCLFWSNDQ